MNNLSIFAMFKCETKWLREWVEYHRIVGAEHFHLVTNQADVSADMAVLRPYIDAGIVDVRQGAWFDFDRQRENYASAARRAAADRSTKWLAFIDLDEFLLPVTSATVPEVLDRFDRPGVSALAVHWRCFGSSGLVQSPESQVRAFLRRAPDDFVENDHVKVIVRPDRVESFDTPHSIVSAPGCTTVNADGRAVTGPRSGPPAAGLIRLNHYCVRSWEDFQVKLGRSSGKGPEFFAHADRNEVFDDLIVRRYGAALAGAMARGPAV